MVFSGSAILLDIEGTIAPIAFVRDVLFTYARRELAGFLTKHWDRPDVADARAQIARDFGAEVLPRAALVDHLNQLMDRDAKATGLKQLQGLIWRRGYESGELRSPLFPDVLPAIRAWRSAGLSVSIYSSGSVAAQKLFLAHTDVGDVNPLIHNYFDTTTGSKRETGSYVAIAGAIGAASGDILFISDVPAELDAATATGIQTLMAVRPGNDAIASGHERVYSFVDVALGR